VTTIPVTDAGDAVLLRRGIEPGYGSWAQPGGFLEVDETVAEAAIRETLEETGLMVEPGDIVGLYSRLEAAVVVLVFEARISPASRNPEALEIRRSTRPIPWDDWVQTSYARATGRDPHPVPRCHRPRGHEPF
jgi:ADP-ribose pyrophosphatase YjhB (NUDIX family)